MITYVSFVFNSDQLSKQLMEDRAREQSTEYVTNHFYYFEANM